jgi:hypothetical protein
MSSAAKRRIFRWTHIVFSIPNSVTFTVRLNRFQTTPPLLGLSSFLYLSYRDFGCGKAMSFDDSFRKRSAQPDPTQKSLRLRRLRRSDSCESWSCT